MADKPFTIIGVNSDKDLGKLRQVVKEKSLTWRSFQNEGNEEKISTVWNIKGWPTTYLIDGNGKIRYKNVRGDKLDEALEELMSEIGEEVNLVGVDHEAEDKAALEAAKGDDDGGAETADEKSEASDKASDSTEEKKSTEKSVDKAGDSGK